MFTRSDLNDVVKTHHALGASLFLPTHPHGLETQQGPIRLNNLITTARAEMLARGVDPAEADATLAPALVLVKDHAFWQHQDLGLAVYLTGATMLTFPVPMPLTEQVVIAPRSYIRPLLPLLADDAPFLVLTMTADQTQLFHATRFALIDAREPSLPTGLGQDHAESDYENPVQASPVARPNTGTVNISNAQVYGDSPPEWRKRRLREYARRTAAAVDAILARGPLPFVLVASGELAGAFSKASTIRSDQIHVIDANPASLAHADLHAAAYAAVRPEFEATRRAAIEQWAMLYGQGDARAITATADIVTAAHRGAVETLFIEDGPMVLGHYDRDSGEAVLADAPAKDLEDLIEAGAVLALQYGSTLHVISAEDISGNHAAAILRY